MTKIHDIRRADEPLVTAVEPVYPGSGAMNRSLGMEPRGKRKKPVEKGIMGTRRKVAGGLGGKVDVIA